MSSYISLEAYSQRYKVSVQEIRKRIELKKIEFVFSNLEYLVKDQPFEQHYQIEKKSGAILNEQKQIRELTLNLKKALKTLEVVSQENSELKNLCSFLENENNQMKQIVLGHRRMDDWLRSNSE